MKRTAWPSRLYRSLKTGLTRAYEYVTRLDTTTDRVTRNAFDYSSGMKGYTPSNWLTVRRIQQTVPFSPDDVFADFGSGKGKMVYLAARYPLKKIIGIEISTQLNDIAIKNIATHRHALACPDIDLLNMDVREFDIPNDLTIAYFFNPFVDEIFLQVIDNIHRSFLHTPRRIWIVYKNPIMRHHLDSCDWLAFETIHHNIAFYRTRM